jgi:hypothetical protein
MPISPSLLDPCGGAQHRAFAPETKLFPDRGLDTIRNYQAGLFFDVTPDFRFPRYDSRLL